MKLYIRYLFILPYFDYCKNGISIFSHYFEGWRHKLPKEIFNFGTINHKKSFIIYFGRDKSKSIKKT